MLCLWPVVAGAPQECHLCGPGFCVHPSLGCGIKTQVNTQCWEWRLVLKDFWDLGMQVATPMALGYMA